MSTKRMRFTVLAVSAIMLALGIGSQLAGARTWVYARRPAEKPDSPGVAIPYPGRLADDTGQPVSDGLYDFTFTLFTAETGGALLWSEVQEGVLVSDGAFVVSLGHATPIPATALGGVPRWLAVAVRGPGETEFTTLTPRQRLSAASPDSPSTSAACPHDHLGETWTDGDGPLVISGSFGAPDFAPLLLGNSHGTGSGLKILSASWGGVVVEEAGTDGVSVEMAGNEGLDVVQAGTKGVRVWRAGNASTSNSSSYHNGLEVAGAEGDGLYVGRADRYGVYVNSTGYAGVSVWSATQNGVEVASAGYSGVVVSSAAYNGVYANTTASNNEWGIYTPDKIYAGTALASDGPLMFVAQNGDAGALEPGDVVAAAGLGAPFADSASLVTLVRRADPARSASAVGVVYRRFVAERIVEKVEREGGVKQRTRYETHSAEGAIAPGEYLLMVVLGVCEVKVDATAGVISPGDSLMLSSSQGRAARARPLNLDGVSFYPPGVTFGTALAPLEKDTGTIPVFVTLQ